MSTHEKMDYIEFPSRDIGRTKLFFSNVFNWQFKNYGPDYISFSDEGLNGGFYRSDKTSSTSNGSALVVFYSNDLQQTQDKITKAGGTIVKPTFSFPGGSRFHFADTNGNEYAVWSDS